jgi:hypothetical protein
VAAKRSQVRWIVTSRIVQDPWDMTGLEEMEIFRINSRGQESQRIFFDELVQGWDVLLSVDLPEIHAELCFTTSVVHVV